MTCLGRLTTLLLLILGAPLWAGAQPAAEATSPGSATQAFGPWIAVGTAFATMRGGCQTCEEDAEMAFVRNWIDVPGASPVTSKALSVVIGAGWTFRTEKRVGLQLFAAQHAAALGDLQRINGGRVNMDVCTRIIIEAEGRIGSVEFETRTRGGRMQLGAEFLCLEGRATNELGDGRRSNGSLPRATAGRPLAALPGMRQRATCLLSGPASRRADRG